MPDIRSTIPGTRQYNKNKLPDEIGYDRTRDILGPAAAIAALIALSEQTLAKQIKEELEKQNKQKEGNLKRMDEIGETQDVAKEAPEEVFTAKVKVIERALSLGDIYGKIELSNVIAINTTDTEGKK